VVHLALVVPFLVGVLCITGICWHFLRRRPQRFLAVYAWSVGLFVAVLALETNPNAPAVVALKDIAVVSGVVLLGAGWFLYGGRPVGHLLTIAGWQGLGIYWMVEVGNYLFLHPEDPTNVILYAPALALFSVFCLHEWDTFKGAKPRRSLKFMAGMTFVASGTYFLFAKVPVFSTALIWVTAVQTSALVNLLGMHTAVGQAAYDTVTGEIAVPVFGSGISIILACTAIEAMVIFFGAFLTVEPRENPWDAYKKITPHMKKYMKMSGRERRTRALLYTILPIWVLNLVRNMAIIWLVNNTGISFDVAHGYIGKGFSFLVLLGLAMVVFDLVPEIYDDLLDLYRLGMPEKGKGAAGSARKTSGPLLHGLSRPRRLPLKSSGPKRPSGSFTAEVPSVPRCRAVEERAAKCRRRVRRWIR
jgi:exosortase/archaeosortase family protein